MGNIIDLKLAEKQKEIAPVQGDFSFSWTDVELVECAANGNAILHFKSGRSIKTCQDFASAKKKFHTHAK